MFGNFSRSKVRGDFRIGDDWVYPSEVCVPLRMDCTPVGQNRGQQWFKETKRKRYQFDGLAWRVRLGKDRRKRA